MTEILNMDIAHQSDYMNWLNELEYGPYHKFEGVDGDSSFYEGESFFEDSMKQYNLSFLQHPVPNTKENREWVPEGHTWYMDQYDYAPNEPVYNSYYTQVDVSHETEETMARVIGCDGCHFKYLTEVNNCLYIWYDGEKGLVEFWGEENTLQPAVNQFHSHLEYMKNNELLGEIYWDSILDDLVRTHGEANSDDDDNGEIWDKVLGYSNQLIGLFIGKGGSGLQKLAHENDLTKLVFDSENQSIKCYGNTEYFNSQYITGAMDVNSYLDNMIWNHIYNLYSRLDSTYVKEDPMDTQYGYYSGW